MKTLLKIFVIGFTFYMLIFNSELKPSENKFLWIAGAIAIIASLVIIISFFVEFKNDNDKPDML